MRRNIMTTLGLLSISLIFTAGCGSDLFPVIEVKVPDAPQYVLDNAADFIPADDDAFLTIEQGTKIDDLADLDGCWAAVLTQADVNVGLALYAVFQFDAAEKTYVSWTFIAGTDTGALWAVMPMISEESGTYEITGDASIELNVTRIRVNVDADGSTILTELREIATDAGLIARPALATLDGDIMLLLIDVDENDDPVAQDDRTVFFKFDCP